jgi:5-methylcytosine-specific restriction endonuclease McrA
VAEFLEQLKLARANWKRNNPDAVKAHTHLRRARAKAAEGRFTATDVKRIFDEQHGQCCACGAGFDIVGYHIDHVVPLSKGGSNYPENIQLLCPTCNTRKATMDFTTFLNRIGKEQHHA